MKCVRASRVPLFAATAFLIAVLPVAASAAAVTGFVKDSTGAVVPGAVVTLRSTTQSVLAATTTDATGHFTLDAPAGRFLLVVALSGFEEVRRSVGTGSDVEVVLSPGGITESVTVTAELGRAEDVDRVPQQVNVISGDDVRQRAHTVVAQVVQEEVGLSLQRTSSTMAGIFVRGLTGNKVNVFVDGVRYSNAAQRGGVNTFLDLIDPELLDGVEVLRGPNSAQYGSDALGGSVQFLTRAPVFTPEGTRLSGGAGTLFNSADRGFGLHGRVAWSSPTFALLASGTGRRAGTIRAGEGIDSHNAVTRFLGVSSDLVLLDGRMPDTEFQQYGGQLKLAWAPSVGSQLSLSYTRSQQDDGKRYDQLLGGDGNLVSDLSGLSMDSLVARYERTTTGVFDHVGLVYSFNSQREERINQGGNGNPRNSINHEPERTNVNGVQLFGARTLGRHALRIGSDASFEKVTDAASFSFNPVTGVTAPRRGRVPDQAQFRTLGVYVADVFQVTDRLQLLGNLRFSGSSYEAHAADSALVNGKPFWPDDSLTQSSVAFRTGAVFTLAEGLNLAATVARGFRAPHITDLGTLGLTGSGFEVAAPDVAGLNGLVGDSAGSSAVSTGRPVEQVRAETSLGGDLGLRFRRERFDTDLTVFVNDIGGNIQKQALILPPGAVGTLLGSDPIIAQGPTGVVFVAASSSPVLVRTNYDDVRIWGIEHTMRAALTRSLRLSTTLTYLHARDKATDLPPNIEGGTPAPDGWLKLRWTSTNQRFWVEPYAHAALTQDDLSSLDLEDRRTGASRSRSSIASFFNNGARARGLVGNGPDGVAGNADDILLATGETLAQVQSRVLGTASSSSLFTDVAGYVTLNLRAGVRFWGRHEVQVEVENITDRNYRGISWGMDAPGRNLYLRYDVRF